MQDCYMPTGNEFVSLPTLDQTTASIESFTVLHMGYKGMLAFWGGESEPLIRPFVRAEEGDLLCDLKWKRECDWIPGFEAEKDGVYTEGIFLAPIGQKAFAIRLTVTNHSGKDREISCGLSGAWGKVTHSVNEDKTVTGRRKVYHSIWNEGPVFDLSIGMPVMAFAPMAALPVTWEFEQGEEIRYKGTHDCRLKSGESVVFDIFWGIGFEEVSAATAAKELLRQNFDAVYEETLCWLRERQKTVGMPDVDSLLNRNLFFNFFYATGMTMDTEEVVMVTSRSPRYYVSAAYWDRDSLLWSFPSILKADSRYAKELLDYVFTRQIRQIGIHSRYIDGTVLEPGFELDELCAPLMALSRYVNATGEVSILKESHIERGVKKILSILKTKRSEALHLYETFLQPTDDMRVYPYGTYDNVLTWRCLRDLEKLYRNLWPTETLKWLEEEASTLFRAICTHCIKEYQGKKLFVWSVDEEGNWDVYDEPPGSLELLPFLGFCTRADSIWQNTVEILRSPDYAYSFAGKPFSDIGCPHAPHPWILSVANGLISGRKEASLDFLRRASMDNGIACESVDEMTGKCTTGAAFATCAGFLAYCLMEGLNEGGVENDSI
ncbi:MAG: glycoside hydrolase family 125 protein [Hungatella sp.]|jgi:hypothetical protein|nr:glycoside hydrolase family 125 protein [Hungatella sp.]